MKTRISIMHHTPNLGNTVRQEALSIGDFLELATKTYRLSIDDIERFDCLYRAGARGRTFGHSFLEEAKSWRSVLRPNLRIDKCSRMKVLATLCNLEDSATQKNIPMNEIPSVARYICCCVEMEVRRLNRKGRMP